jgi:hypothetical protein
MINMKIKSRNGFTLTEAVVSVLILVIIWISAVNALIAGKHSSSYSRHKVQAIYAAQRKIEDLRKATYPPTASTTTIRIDTKATPDNTADDFTGTQIVTVGQDLGYYRQVNVEIRWNESFFGRTKQMREYCSTYIANEPQVN